MKPIPSVLAAPWAIEPQWLRVVYAVWSRGQLDAAALANAKAEWEARQRQATKPRVEDAGAVVEGTGGTLSIIGDVGVVTIEGPLFRHANLFSDFSGGTTYDALWRGLQAAEASSIVTKILLRVNSPGGEADGCNELAKYIASLSKPTEAFVDGMCASAALWLASQCDTISAEETAEIGSIGVRVGLTDYSAANEAEGVREIEVISSQSPGKRSKPIDDDVIGRIQTRVDDLADIFVAAVAKGRGVSAAKVVEDFGGGDVMIASKALDAGLIDNITSYTGALASLAASQPTGRTARKEANMATTQTKPTAGEAPEWQCAGCNEMMGGSAKSYCAKCAEGGDDDEGDEEDAKALGLDVKASADVRRMRMAALVELEQKVLAATGETKHEAALERVRDGLAASIEIAKVKAQASKLELKSKLERGLQGGPGGQPTLSLGRIQKNMSSVLRGESKKAWVAAMEKLKADAEVAGATIKAEQVIAAAASVELSADDMAAIDDYIAGADPVAAATYVEPKRSSGSEADDLNETNRRIDAAADRARALLDRHNPQTAK